MLALRDRVAAADDQLRGARPGAATSTTSRTRRARSPDLEVAVSNSFGFGGHNAALVFGAGTAERARVLRAAAARDVPGVSPDASRSDVSVELPPAAAGVGSPVTVGELRLLRDADRLERRHPRRARARVRRRRGPTSGSRATTSSSRELEPTASSTYREVMTEAMRRLGAPAGEEGGLADSLPSWQPFPEVPRRARGARAAAAGGSRSSRTPTADLIEASKELLGVPFDETVVASEIGSYKPAPQALGRVRGRTCADPARHVHVAASHFHDIVPATELGIPNVWINRLGERPSRRPRGSCPTSPAAGHARRARPGG